MFIHAQSFEGSDFSLGLVEVRSLSTLIPSKGRTSWPDPPPVQDFDKLDGSVHLWMQLKGRDSVKPGITGLWQICGRSAVGFREMVLLDFYYIENQSVMFDLEIFFATIPVVLFGKGAY